MINIIDYKKGTKFLFSTSKEKIASTFVSLHLSLDSFECKTLIIYKQNSPYKGLVKNIRNKFGINNPSRIQYPKIKDDVIIIYDYELLIGDDDDLTEMYNLFYYCKEYSKDLIVHIPEAYYVKIESYLYENEIEFRRLLIKGSDYFLKEIERDIKIKKILSDL